MTLKIQVLVTMHRTHPVCWPQSCNLKSSQILFFFFRFSPCILFYLMGSVPAIWFLEIDRLERFTDISSSSNITNAQNEALSTINGVNINNLYITYTRMNRFNIKLENQIFYFLRKLDKSVVSLLLQNIKCISQYWVTLDCIRLPQGIQVDLGPGWLNEIGSWIT